MNTDELKIEHRGIRMSAYKIKTYNVVRICNEDMSIIFSARKNMWIGYDCISGEYVIYISNPCEIYHAIPINPEILTLFFINEKSGQALNLCCDQYTIIFDRKENMWKICISRAQSKFVRDGLRELFNDAEFDRPKTKTKTKINSTPVSISPAQAPNLVFNCILPEIKDVIFNAPATIVFWEDGTKTVVKAQEEDFDPEKGLAMAISKKALGNEGNYYETIKKWMKE